MHRTQNPTAPAADTDNDLVVTPADILRGAACYLELHGWIQGDYYAFTAEVPFPPACVTGAIGMSAHGTRIEYPTRCSVSTSRDFRVAFNYLSGYLADNGLVEIDATDPEEIGSVAPFGWNDADDQTAETVIATLRAAADEYDRQHAIKNRPTDERPEEWEVPLLDTGGYLACGCHGSQRDHTCGPRD
jgi:hypothetical protein